MTLGLFFMLFYRSFDRAIEEWGRFHCDLKDLTQWLTEAETLLLESVGPDGQLDLGSARQHQEVGSWGGGFILQGATISLETHCQQLSKFYTGQLKSQIGDTVCQNIYFTFFFP